MHLELLHSTSAATLSIHVNQTGCVMWAGIFLVPEATGKNVRVASTIHLIVLKQIKPPPSSGEICWWLSPSASPAPISTVD